MLGRIKELMNRYSKAYFQTDDDGRIIYYPWGLLGGGMIIPTETMRDRLGLIHSVFLFAAIAIGALSTRLGPVATVFAAAVHIVTLIAIIALLCRRLPRSLKPFDRKEASRAGVDAVGKPVVFVLYIMSAIFALLGIAIMAHGDLWLGGQTLLIFGLIIVSLHAALRA